MRKLPLTAALLAACAVCLVAQEVPGTSASTFMSDVSLLNTRKYNEYFGFNDGNINIRSRYILSATKEERDVFAGLQGKETIIDTPLEFALLSYYSPITIEDATVRANADSVLPKNNPRAAGLKLGSAVLKELAELKFLDPSNTAAIGRYEGMIKFISDKNGVSRAEMQDYLRQGIAAVVREKFNEISFRFENWTNSYASTLSLDPKTERYTLTYCGHYTGNVVKTISGNGLDGLLTAMKNSPDFDVRGSGFRQIQEEAGHIPAVVYGSWVDKKMTTVDAVKLAADTVADFYLNPSRDNYELLVGMFGLFDRKGGDPVAAAGRDAYNKSLAALNAQVREKAGIDSLSKGAALSRVAIAHNPDYSIFTRLYR
jgi:hypothetical protein